MSNKPVLYSYWRSSCSWRVRAALELKGIEYVYKPIDLLKDEHLSEEFLKINPLGRVPALVIDGATLVESFAILEYLEEKYPDKCPLLPKESVDRAKVRAIALQVIAGTQPLQNIGVLKQVSEICGEQKGGNAWAKKWIEDGFERLERQLHMTAKTYAFGDALTLADLCIAPQVYNAKRYGVNVDAYPTIKRIDETLMGLDALKKSHPSSQPDVVAVEK
uniref:maleylacetoacetate isomerase n=1 Tax=Parascaris univalens TaxID=6257 RepID=A0A915AVY7_PARUN